MGCLAPLGRWVVPIAMLAASGLVGCASGSGRGTVHVVAPGETVWRISHRYGVSTQAVLRANHIRDVNNLQIGQRLWIPGARRRAVADPVPPLLPPRSRPAAAAVRPACLGSPGQRAPAFIWPVQGKLTSRFGQRGRRRHDGIDLSAPSGTPVRAAAAGRVIHSGKGLGAYGNVVIVKHVGRWATVYAHNRRNLVRKGAFVEKGQRIAEVGRTGNATGPHLHFEIRRGDAPRDPIPCLP